MKISKEFIKRVNANIDEINQYDLLSGLSISDKADIAIEAAKLEMEYEMKGFKPLLNKYGKMQTTTVGVTGNERNRNPHRKA